MEEKKYNLNLIIGVALVLTGGYLIWKENQKKLNIDAFTTKVIGERSKRAFAGSNLPAVQSPFSRL